MSKGPQLRELKLTAQETNQLLEWTRRHKTSQALALRARIILACAEGQNNSEVARSCRVIRQTVGKWRSRFVDAGSTDCSMSRGPVRRASSMTHESSS